MNNYTIYCTEEQTKKALELGAPIAIYDYEEKEANIFWRLKFLDLENGLLAKYPTAEQMIGWLETQKDIECIDIYKMTHKSVKNTPWTFDINCIFGYSYHTSRKEATLAAINAALDYLSKKEDTTHYEE